MILILLIELLLLVIFINGNNYHRKYRENNIHFDDARIAVRVYHYILRQWGDSIMGIQNCSIPCDWAYADDIKNLREKEQADLNDPLHSVWIHSNLHHHNHHNGLIQRYNNKTTGYYFNSSETITVAVYNIHSWWQKTRSYSPSNCELPTNFTLAESEESFVRYSHLFGPSFKNFDGFSTTSPTSHVQVVYYYLIHYHYHYHYLYLIY